MSERHAVVVDTNIFVSGITETKTYPNQVLQLLRTGSIWLSAPEDVKREYRDVFSRERTSNNTFIERSHREQLHAFLQRSHTPDKRHRTKDFPDLAAALNTQINPADWKFVVATDQTRGFMGGRENGYLVSDDAHITDFASELEKFRIYALNAKDFLSDYKRGLVKF